MLYAGSKLGTYIGIAKGSELEKFVLSQGFALENGTIKLSASLLKRLTELDFSEYSKSYNETLTQKSFGVEHSYRFDNDKLLQEIKTSIVYYNLDGKNLGHITDIIIDNATLYDWSAVYGGYRGGNKILGMTTGVFKLSDALRATLSLGYDKLTYDAMFDTPKSDSAKLASGASLAYRFNNYHQVESYIQNLNSQQTL